MKRSKTNVKGIYYDPVSKTYSLDVIATIDHCPAHIYELGLATLEEAKKRLKETKESLKEKRGKPSLGKTSLSSFFLSFQQYRSLHVRGSSLLSSRSLYNVYLKEYEEEEVYSVFSKPLLTKIHSSIISNPKTSSPWKNKTLGNLRLMVRFAYSRGYIPSSISSEALSLLENIQEREKRIEKVIWTKEEERRFLSSIKKKEHQLMFRLFLSLGARISEFLGLTWDCLDLRKRKVSIHQQLLWNSQRKFVLSPLLKTKVSYRECYIPSSLAEELADYKKESNADSSPSPFLFHSPCSPNLPLSKAAFRHLLDAYIKKAGVRRITPHGFRHMMATRLVRECRNMMEVKASAKFLGHSPSMMMDIYSHSEEKTILNLLERMEKKSKGNKEEKVEEKEG